MFPFRGSMHYCIGVEKPADWPAVWRWTGSSFQKIDKAEAESIMNSFKLVEEIITREGWHLDRLHFSSREVTVPFQLSTNGFVLLLQENDSDDTRKRTLLLRRGKSEADEQVLVRASDSYKMVGQETYLQFIGK